MWLRNTLLHAGQWVEAMGPLADDPAVQQVVAARVTNAVVEGTDLEDRIADVLPGRAKAAAPFIAGGAAQVVDRVTLRIVESEKFRDLWEVMLRRAHRSVLAVLQGEGTDSVQTRQGRIVVTTGPVDEEVLGALQRTGIGFFDGIDASRVEREIVLVDSEGLRRAQDAVDTLDTLANVLPFVTLGLFAIAVALSGNRRRTALRSALGIAPAVGIVLP